MRLPTQILLLGAILTNGARANETAPAPAPETPTPEPSAVAPTGDVVQLEPLRVTADLWETPLEKTTASVSIYEGAALETSGVRHFGDLADQIPNLTWTGGTSRPRFFQIRGVGENSQFEGETPDSAVAFKVDDLDFTGLGGIGSTFDVRQVEVLRGPQAGAFGANAAGGVIQIVTNDPIPEWNGHTELTVGEDNLREAGVAAGGTLTPKAPEKLMLRIAVQHSESDGFRRNVTLDSDTNARDEDMARVKLAWNPNGLWRWDATVLWAQADNGYDEFANDNNGRLTYSDHAGRDEQRSVAGSVRGVYSGFQDARLTLVTSVSGTDSVYHYDADWGTGALPSSTYAWVSDLRRDRRVYSQEVRLDSAVDEDALGWIDRWTLGAYGSAIKEDGLYTDPFTVMNTDYESRNAALFGQIGHDFGAADRLTLGLRGEWIESESSIASGFDDTLWGSKAAWEHDFTANQTGFVSVARGYKAGGVATDTRLGASDPRSYDSETLWNYEIGLRSQALEKRLTNRLTAFWISRRDTQVRDSAGFGGNFYFYTDNGGPSETYGLEDEISYLVADHWSVYGGLALMESDIDQFTLSNGVDVGGGRELSNVPSYGYSIGVRRAPTRGVFGNVELVARDSYYESNTHSERRSAYEVVNASLGYAWPRWRLTAWVRNAFDEDYEKRVFFFDNGFGAQRYESKADPRQFGVTAAYQF